MHTRNSLGILTCAFILLRKATKVLKRNLRFLNKISNVLLDTGLTIKMFSILLIDLKGKVLLKFMLF